MDTENKVIPQHLRGIFGDLVYGRTHLVEALKLAYYAGGEEVFSIVAAEVEDSTGPTGGWLDSPKAILASIREKVREQIR